MLKIKLGLLSLMMAAAPFVSFSQTADDIIQKHIDAIGGADNWKKVTSMKMSGSSNMQGVELPINITIVNKKAMKVDFTYNGMTGYTIVTDKDGWMYQPFAGQTKPEAMPADLVKQQQDGLDIQGVLLDYKAKGHKVAFVGKDDVEGTECYKLKITMASGKEETVYIDASNFYQIRSVEKITADGKEMEQTSNYGNFQKLPEGITVPMSIDMGMGGPLSVKSVEINKPIPDNFFQPTEMATKK